MKGTWAALVGSHRMEVEATTASPAETAADTIVIGVFENEGVAHDLPDGGIGRLLEAGEARREASSLAVLHAQDRRYIVAGLGARAQFDSERARAAAAAAHGRARELGTATMCWEVPHHVGTEIIAGLVEGTLLHAYHFDRYKPAERAREVERLILSAHHDISEPVRRTAIVAAAQNRARDLGNTPSNDLTPAALAGYARELTSREPAIAVQALDGAAIREAGMGAFAAVAQGSANEPRLIRLAYDGAGDGTPPLGLVGKAVTFDSGGLSLKPPGSMHEMKFDMAGGAAVIETVAALAELGAPVNVLGVVGATENLPSGSAVKPGDIVRALDGTTIEVNNTDAEGRLVLADCLTYAVREGAARLLDVATLTGGIVVALGSVYAGLFSNDDAWAARVQGAAERSGELVWRQPLHREYARMVEGRYAQLTNRADRREATAVTAAEFLHHFAGAVPWAHLDIAGAAYGVRRPYFVGKGATGFGVRLMVELATAGGVTP
jgi:leucyl aminopeptidase